MSEGHEKESSLDFHNVGKTWRTREDYSLAYQMQQDEWDVTKSGNINRHQTLSGDLKTAKLSQEEEDLLRKEQERLENELLEKDRRVSDQLYQSEVQELEERNRIAQRDASIAEKLQKRELEEIRIRNAQQAAADEAYIQSLLSDEIKQSHSAEEQDMETAAALQREEVRKARAVLAARALAVQDRKIAAQLQRDELVGNPLRDTQNDAEMAAALQLSERRRQLQAKECRRQREMSDVTQGMGTVSVMGPTASSSADNDEYDI